MIEAVILILLILVPSLGGYYLLMNFIYKYNTKQRYHKAINREMLGDFKGALEILLTCQTHERYVSDKIAELATEINENVENIGARRLHTIMEKLLEDISYNASDMSPQQIKINKEYVEKNLGELIKSQDLSKFIL